MRVSAGSALEYAAMPGIFPRVRDLLFTGFGSVTYLVAIICFMVGLLPKNHPCFAKENRDHYSLTKILAAAANNVTFAWKHADQVIIFSVIVCGTVMMSLYLVGVIVFLFVAPAYALGSVMSGMFVTANPTNDIAFMMMDKVFGLPGLYNSVVSQTAPFPNPFQVALHQLFYFYSMGIFFIALTIFLYHVIDFMFDVTQTGKVSEHLSDEVDGERGFSWLPIRFVVCFGLLIPFGDGLNSAQWLTLYTAKFGSGMATNAWIEYNLNTGDNPTGEDNAHLISKPRPMDNTGLMKGLFMIRSCAIINNLANNFNLGGKSVKGYVINSSSNRPLFNDPNGGQVGFFDDPINGGQYNASPQGIADAQSSDNFIDILSYSNFSDIRIVVGEYLPNEPGKYADYPGGVFPACGELTIPVTGQTGESIFATEGYLFAVMNILFDVNRPGIGRSDEERALSTALTREYTRNSSLLQDWQSRTYGKNVPQVVLDNYICGNTTILGDCKQAVVPSYWKTMMQEYYQYAFSVPTYTAYDFLANTDTAAAEIDPDGYYILSAPSSFSTLGVDNPLMISTGILKYGWGGAGLWYNKISERNGSLYSAVTAVPVIKRFPYVMEENKLLREKTDNKITGGFCEKFNPQKSGTSSSYSTKENNQFAAEEVSALYNLCTQLFENDAINLDGVARTTQPTNPVLTAIQSFFSEFKLFDVDQNHDVTPMAQLSAIGKLMMNKAIIGVAASSASYALGGMSYMNAAGDDKMAESFASAAGLAADSIMTFALLGMISGLILYYMLPLMPFVYFFFAVGRWVKVVFEALVGVPLWALAHMRVGGPGLPGSAASGGYFLLLEIFIRPILTVFSLIVSFALFSALTVGLNAIFLLVSQNLFGVSPSVNNIGGMLVELSRGVIDQFFLSLLYIALVYMIGAGSFKLIDLVPDGIMRWSGAGVQAMGASDISDDLIDNWQWELPARFGGVTEDIKEGIKDLLYDQQEKDFAKRKAALAQKKSAQTEKEEMDQLAEQAQNQPGDGE